MNIYKKKFNTKPIVLGNWSDKNKGSGIINKLSGFIFKKLNIKPINNNIDDFNIKKQDIYLNADIFLQVSNSEGNSYSTLDALLCGLVVVASNVGLFYKDVPDNCFIKLDWNKNKDSVYISDKLSEAWEKREELSKNARQWYLDNCRFIEWEKKMKDIISS